MKIASYFMKVGGACLIAICGLVMFISDLASNIGSVSGAFWGLAVMSAGAILLAIFLESCKCPLKLSVVKKEETPKEKAAPAAKPAKEEAAPVVEEAKEEATEATEESAE